LSSPNELVEVSLARTRRILLPLVRKKELNHESVRNMVFYAICLVGICVGLYLLVVKGEKTLGSNLVTASFVALLGGKSILPKGKAD
jgi:hypothetical protein